MARIVLALLSSFILTSCFVADEIFLENDSTPNTDNLQLKSEIAVKNYINEDLSKENNYLPYGFSDIKIIKPIALVELENIELELKKFPNDTVLENRYLEKKEFVRKMQIERVIKLDHFFTIETDSNAIEVLEMTYYINDTFGIKSFEPKIILSIPIEMGLILDYYFNEYTIIMGRSYSESRKSSLSFYRFFKDRLDQIESVQQKSKFLKHSLTICQLVKVSGDFNQNFIAQALLKNYINTVRTDISNYEAIDFTELYETQNNDNNEVVGYYFFHKFSGTYNNTLDTNVVLIEFSPYYEVDQIFQMDQPFETYIKATE